jgi:hypothetical protein
VSTSIRPPTGSSGGAAGVEGPGEASEVSGAGEAGQSAEIARNQAAGSASASAVESPTHAWLHKLAAGEVTRAEAVEGLVAQALEAQGASRLSPGQRSELESVLRSALLEDPVLSRLLGG